MLPPRLPRQVHLRVIEVLLGDFGLVVGALFLLGRFELSLLSLGTNLLGLTACAGFGLPQTDRRLVSDSLGAGCFSVARPTGTRLLRELRPWSQAGILN
jgi:hypothetical protein